MPRPPEVVRRRRAALTADDRRTRARVAANRRWHPDRPGLTDEHRALRVAAAERYITELVAAWPPLTAAQRNRLATLMAVPEPEGEGAGDG
jgi:hypothetical protein